MAHSGDACLFSVKTHFRSLEFKGLPPCVFDGANNHRGPTQSVCVADSYFIVNVLELPF